MTSQKKESAGHETSLKAKSNVNAFEHGGHNSCSVASPEQQADRIVAGHFSPVSIIVDNSGHIGHVSGPAHHFLRIPNGIPSCNVLSLLRNGLHLVVSDALGHIWREWKPIHRRAGCVRTHRHFHHVAIDLIPLVQRSVEDERHVLLVFRDLGQVRHAEQNKSYVAAMQMDQELSFVRAQLERQIEQQQLALTEQQSQLESHRKDLEQLRERECHHLNVIERMRLTRDTNLDHIGSLRENINQQAEQLRLLMGTIAMAEVRERKAIARDLHDELAQLLIVIKLKLEAMLDQNITPFDRAIVLECHALSTHADRAARTIMTELAPPALENGGLMGGIEWLQTIMRKRYGLTVEIEAAPFADPPEPARTVLFRAVRELLINTAKHAGTSIAHIKLSQAPGKPVLTIVVEDFGCGFNLEETLKRNNTNDSGFGLSDVCERAEFIGGQCEVLTQPEHGTRVCIHYPLPDTAQLSLA